MLKRLLLLVLAALIVPQPAVAQADAVKEVLALEDAWAAAGPKKDIATLSKLLADDFTWVSPEGRLLDKTAYLAFTKSYDNEGLTSHAEGYKARVYGNALVITGIYVETKKTASGSTTSRSYWTDTWVKSGDAWKCVASHNTIIK